jgi:riboflavin kinase / FMN adenylyltransferase
MQIHVNPTKSINEPLAVTIGNFDGVHLGHKVLLELLMQEAGKRNLQTGVLSFDKNPKHVLDTATNPISMLTTFAEKRDLLAKIGIQHLFVQEFTTEFAQITPQQYLLFLSEVLQVKFLLVGYDHKFGKDRSGNWDLICDYAPHLGMEVMQLPAQYVEQNKVSSTEIRQLLRLGEVQKANLLLGYDYTWQAEVIHGQAIGRTIGFPTANLRAIEAEKILPKPGVYAVWVTVQAGVYKGMLNIGTRPTVSHANTQQIEVHILDFQGDLYGEKIDVAFVHFLREEKRFESIDALQNALEVDKKNVEKLLKTKNL